jgi:hypothetical protein
VAAEAPTSSLTAVPPFDVTLQVLHVLGPSGERTVAHHLDAQRAGGWHVSVHVLGRLSGGRALTRTLMRTDPDVVVLHGAVAGLVGRLSVRGRRTTALQLGAWAWRRVPRALRWPVVLWERVAGRWVNVVLLGDPAEAADGVERKVWVPPFVVTGSVQQTAAVLSRAHVFGQAAKRQGMPKGSSPSGPSTQRREVTRADEEPPPSSSSPGSADETRWL